MDRRELDLLGLCALIEERSRSWEVKRPDVALDAPERQAPSLSCLVDLLLLRPLSVARSRKRLQQRDPAALDQHHA